MCRKKSIFCSKIRSGCTARIYRIYKQYNYPKANSSLTVQHGRGLTQPTVNNNFVLISLLLRRFLFQGTIENMLST